MKKLFLATLILVVAIANAQIQWAEDIPIRQGENIEWSRAAISVDGGSVVYVWSDTRRGDRDLWAQKMDASGNKLWGEDAILVNGEINRQEDPVVIHVGDGNVIIAWVEFRYEDAGDVFVQKLDINGNLQWDTAGIPLCLAEVIQISLNIVSDNNGGAFVIWLDDRNNNGGSDIYGTRILSDGSIAAGWVTNGNAIIAESAAQNQHTFWEDGSGGAILAWHDTRNANDENIYIQRIASDGSLFWNTTGVLLCNDPGIQETPKMTPDGTGNFIFTWRDKRSDTNGDIYAQRADINGNLLWTSEIEVYTGDGVQENPRITQSFDNGAIITWEDGRNEIGEIRDIYVQKVNIDGNLVWDADGVPIAVADNDQAQPRLIGDENGGAWITWEDGRIEDHPFGDIYVQHVNSSGSVLLPTNGKEICTEVGFQFSPLIKRSGNEIFLTWGDNRTGSTGIYIQILDNSGNTLLEENGEIIFYGLCGDALNYQIFPNGNNQVIVWEDTRNASIARQIYYQVLNNDGSFELEEDGQPITTMTGFHHETMDADFYPDSNILGVVWEENKEGYKQIYAQAVDLIGNFLWSDSIGVRVGESTAEQNYPKISTINNGGIYEFYIGWEDFIESDSRINGQKIVDGVLQWGPGGKTIVDRDGKDELCDIVDNFYIWRNISWPDYYVYAKLVDENGNTAPGWEEDGKLICGAPGIEINAKGLLVPQGLLIVWEDPRVDTLALDIYGQIVTEDGTTLWQDDGIPLVSLENDQYLSNFLYNDGIVLVWEDFRSGTNYDIYIQKFDESGNGVWQENGVGVIVNNFNQQSSYLVSNGEDYMVFCENYETGEQSNLFAQMLDENGEIQWFPDGFVICDAIKNQKKPMAVTDGDYTYVIYEDTRSSGKTDIYNIYAQKVKFDTVDVDEDEIHHENYVLNQNYPNPFKSSTAISFNLNPGTLKKAKVKIYNIKGQQVKSIDVETNKLFWNGKDNSGKSVANGIYFYRLEADDYKSKPRKMVLLK